MAFAAAARLFQDDHVSVASYRSDAYTLPGQDMQDDARSIMTASSVESYDSFWPRERFPSYRVPKEQGASQPVYEAWILCMSHETGHEVTKLTSCGFNILSTHDEEAPWVYCRTEPYEQQDLSEMTLAAVSRYHAANKRSLPSRLIRGTAKSYEQDLDQRINKLPLPMQSELNGLLRRREEATSNRFHRREWTVAMLREQYRYRFASAKPEEVKRSGGFWKTKDRRRIEYLFIIRGADGKVASDDKGMCLPREFGNPWKKVDEYERWERERVKDMKRFGKGFVQDGWRPRPRGRSLSPARYPSPPPCPPSQPVYDIPFDDIPHPPPRRRVRVERGRDQSQSRSRSRSRSRSPPYGPSSNESFHPINPFVPGQSTGSMMPTPADPFTCNFPPEAPVSRPAPYGGFPHHCHGNCGLPGPHMIDFLPPPPPPAGFASLRMPPPGTTPPPEPPHSFAMPSLSQTPNFLGPVNSPYPLGGSSLAPPPPPEFFDYVRCGSAAPPATPPPAPRPSNLTTPTTFSRATTNHTGSTCEGGKTPAPVESGMEVFLAEEHRPASLGMPALVEVEGNH